MFRTTGRCRHVPMNVQSAHYTIQENHAVSPLYFPTTAIQGYSHFSLQQMRLSD
uniref:Uncharacterized protein n=1 Tax=Anguilla anguilla TaxID=7936 RepID=A0A0E9WEY9_ANGAN